MFTNRYNRLRLLVIALVFAVGMVFALACNNALAQGPDLQDIDTRLKALEKTVDNLFTFIILIPTLSALMVAVLEIRTWATERAERQLAWAREGREAQSAATVDAVMNSVNQLLAFQAAQAEQQKELLEKFNPSRGVEVVFDQVRELRRQVKRHNLHQYYSEIVRLADRMRNMEDLYVLPDFDRSVGCHYIRGLAGLLENQIEVADSHLRAVSELMTDEGQKERGEDAYIEPLSLYFLGIHWKNLALFDQSLQSLERALSIWPKSEREIRTRVEIAEVVALQTGYADAKKRTKEAWDIIHKVLEDDRAGEQKLTEPQKRNLEVLRERLFLIEGNYAFRREDWDEAIKYYEEGRRINPNSVFTGLSIGLALWRKGLVDDAKQELEKTYHLIVDSDQHVIHTEPRGRILLGGSAVIAAKFSGLGDLPELLLHVLREMEDLRWRNPRTGHTFHIFSPLTKQMHTLVDFRSHIDRPLDFLR